MGHLARIPTLLFTDGVWGGAWFGLLQWNSSRIFIPSRVKKIGLQNQEAQETEGKKVVFG